VIRWARPWDVRSQSQSRGSNVGVKANRFNTGRAPPKGFKTANADNRLAYNFATTAKPNFGADTPPTDFLPAAVSMTGCPPFRDAS